MKALTNITVQNNCVQCVWREEHYFCSAPFPVDAIQRVKATYGFSKGTLLFLEGQPSAGVYILCRGRVKLSTYSQHGKAIILGVAGPGDVLGISSAIGSTNYDATAQVIEECQVNFIRKAEFVTLIREHSAAALKTIMQLSNACSKAHAQIRSLGHSVSVSDKLARLFLDWCESFEGRDIHIEMPYTHEEIAEMIGTSRETVTRLINDFKRRELITLNGGDLQILDKEKLRAVLHRDV